MEKIQNDAKLAQVFNGLQGDYDKLIGDVNKLIETLNALSQAFYGDSNATVTSCYKTIKENLGTLNDQNASFLGLLNLSYGFCQTVDAQIQTKIALYSTDGM